MFHKGACAVLGALMLLAVPAGADVLDKASIGASGGVMNFLSGENFSETNPRGLFQAVFKYNFHPKWAAVLESGWGWADYPDPFESEEADTLVVVIPTTFGLERRWQWGESSMWPHAAVGGGFYWLGVKDSFRSWARSGDQRKELTWVSPGLYGKIGGEYLFDSGVSMNFDLLYHYIFSQNESDYYFTYQPGDENDPERVELSNTWGNHSTSFAQFRIGVNYYFEPKPSRPAEPVEAEEPETPEGETEP